MTDGEDLMTQLPKLPIKRILSFLDAKSLFNCTRVNRDWDELTDLLQPRFWFKACLNAGIDVEENKYQDAREWKVFLSSMVQRLKDMKISNCFEGVSYPFLEPVKAISYYNAKFAAAFSNYIVMLDMSDGREENGVILVCNFQLSYLKFDGKTVVAASTSGHMSCWSTALDNHLKEYRFPEGTLLSFDFLTEYSILVGSIQTDDSASIIYLWRLSGNRVSRRVKVMDKIIYRVILAPNRDSPARKHQRKKCYLFGLAEDCVRVWKVKIRSQIFSVKVSTTFTIPTDPNIHGDVDDTPPFGFLFDGTELFIMTPSPGRSPRIIWAWDFREDKVRCFGSSHPIINLLGVGKKYLVYKVRNRDDCDDAVCAVDKITNENVAGIRAPRLPSTSDSLICLGHTSWMDGLNGENDRGVVFASVREDPSQVALSKFLPRR